MSKETEGFESLELRKNLRNSTNLGPEVRFILAIIESGIRENDEDYFQSKTFDYHMGLLKLSAKSFKKRYNYV